MNSPMSLLKNVATFNWVFSYYWVWIYQHILGSSHLSDIWFSHIFSESLAFLFCFLTLYFKEQEVFNFDKVVNFSFMDYDFGVISKNFIKVRSKRFPPTFSSESYKSLHINFWSILSYFLSIVRSIEYGWFFRTWLIHFSQILYSKITSELLLHIVSNQLAPYKWVYLWKHYSFLKCKETFLPHK